MKSSLVFKETDKDNELNVLISVDTYCSKNSAVYDS